MGGWWTYAFIARIANCHLRRCAINKGHPAHQRREARWLIVIKRGILGTAFLAISLGSTLGGRGPDAEQGTGGAGVRGEAADGACGFARHPRFSCSDCDRRREHRFRRRPGLADAAHSPRGRRQCWWRHRYFRAFDRAAAGGDSRPSSRGREPRRRRRHHGSGGGREVPEGWLHRVHDEQCARDFSRDVQGAALRPDQRLPNGVDGRDCRSRSCGRARLSRQRPRGRAGGGARQPRKIQFRQRRRRYDPAFRWRADEADRQP